MAATHYKKTINNFCAADWKCLGLTLGIEKSQLSSLRKNQVIKLVLTKQPKLLDTPENFYYFNQTAQGIKIISDEPANKDVYLESKINYSWHLSTDQLREIMNTEETKSEADESTHQTGNTELDSLDGDQEQPDLNRITTMLENLTSQSFPKISKLVTPKIRYDSNIEIRRFLGQVETYAAANSISTDSNLIAIALAAMDQSDEGSLVKDTLEDKDMESWANFKNKLIRLLGHTEEYYRNYFQSFKRGSMRIGLALSCLTQAFKRGWNINRELTKLEEDMILSQFINSLDGPLKVLLKSEIKKLNFGSVTERALELEACLGKDSQINALSLGPQAVDQINAIQPHSTQFAELISLFKQQHAELMKVIANAQIPEQNNQYQRNNNSRSGRSNQNRPARKRLSDELKTLLNNMCIRYAKGKRCTLNGCKFRHTGVISDELRQVLRNN